MLLWPMLFGFLMLFASRSHDPLFGLVFGSIIAFWFYMPGFLMVHLPLLLISRFIAVSSRLASTHRDDQRFSLVSVMLALLIVPLHWKIVNYWDILNSVSECEALAVGCGIDRGIMPLFAFASAITGYVAARAIASD
jgi:hypothetical protein